MSHRRTAMPDYRCPNCGGGFPHVASGHGECPWCGQALDGSYEYEPRVSRVVSEDDSEGGPIYRKLVGWLE